MQLKFLQKVSREGALFGYCKPDFAGTISIIADRLNRQQRNIAEVVDEVFAELE